MLKSTSSTTDVLLLIENFPERRRPLDISHCPHLSKNIQETGVFFKHGGEFNLFYLPINARAQQIRGNLIYGLLPRPIKSFLQRHYETLALLPLGEVISDRHVASRG